MYNPEEGFQHWEFMQWVEAQEEEARLREEELEEESYDREQMALMGEMILESDYFGD